MALFESVTSSVNKFDLILVKIEKTLNGGLNVEGFL